MGVAVAGLVLVKARMDFWENLFGVCGIQSDKKIKIGVDFVKIRRRSTIVAPV
jgi:hypothetical protein